MTTSTRKEITNVSGLNARIRELADGEPNPGRVAEKLLAEMARAEMMVLARAAARNYVRLVMGHLARRFMPPSDGPFVPEQRTESTPVKRFTTRDGQTMRSAKWASVRDSWIEEQLKERPVAISDDNWLYLGKCSPADLLAAAENRYRKADSVRSEGDWYKELSDTCVQHKVAKVEDLPRDVLREVLVK